MKAYHIYLIRHGMTQANKEGRYVGRIDHPLCKEGVAQLEDMARQFDYPQAEAFYASPLTRCRQTLEILYPGSSPKIVDGLRECDFGVYEGKTMEELKDDPGYQTWAAGGGKAAPPQGESAAEFQKRCCAAFEGVVDELLRTGTTRAVIAAHGGTIMFILGTYGYPRKPFYEWMSGNGMGYEVVVTPQLWMSGKAMDIAAKIPEQAQGDHLAGLDAMVEEMKNVAEAQK